MSKKPGRPKGSDASAIQKIQLKIIQYLKENPGTNPTRVLSDQFQVSRQAILGHINRMLASGVLTAEGSGKGRVYFVSSLSPLTRTLQRSVQELAERGEDDFFRSYLADPLSSLTADHKGLFSRAQYALTEILNNVIDHSHGSLVIVRIDQSHDDQNIRIEVEDNGRGVFETIRAYFSLKDHWESVGELAKGKRTTDPSRHAGEGLFFSARMADFFEIAANSLCYQYSSEQDDWSMRSDSRQIGTLVRLTLKLSSNRTPQDVFERYTKDYSFEQKSPRLANPYTISLPPGHLPSRSEAKKILAGAEAFASIIIDFKGVESIGQGFAHEIFRVFKGTHPQIEIAVKNASSFVLRMIAHVQKGS